MNTLLLIRRELFYIIWLEEILNYNNFLNYKCLNCIPYTQIIVAGSCVPQIQQINED